MGKERFENLTDEDIKKIVLNNPVPERLIKLKKYYIGNHDILNHRMNNSKVPNNRLVNNIAKYITDTATGYFIGMPVAYSSMEEDYMYEMQAIYDYNDEQDHNLELAKNISIYGSSFEMLYLDEESHIRIICINPADLIMIRDLSYKGTLGAIRIVWSEDAKGKPYRKIEFYTDTEIKYYDLKDNKIYFKGAFDHYFGAVPVVEYVNNEERLGDFEGVITLIDAYNKVQSNTANTFQYNDEAILKVVNLGSATNEDIAQMKEDGAIILNDGGDIGWALKTLDDTALENYKKRLRDDIHIFSNVPNMADENFGTNLSGVAVSYKLWGLEQITAIKERKFKKGLLLRMKLMTNILNIKGGNYKYKDIEITFRRNKPQNLLETAQIVSMLSGELSRETRLKMLPQVEDPVAEIEKLEAEKDTMRDDFSLSNDFLENLGGEHEHS